MRPSLFIGIPRNASRSIMAAMDRHGLRRIKLVDGETCRVRCPEEPLVTFYHAAIPALVEAGIITEAWLRNRFVFAFARDPWSRTVSLYHYLFKVRGSQRQYPHVQTFADFVKEITARPVDPIGAYNHRRLSQANPQTAWLFDDLARTTFDYLGRFERLEDDWRLVCQQIGLPETPLPKIGKSPGGDYRRYYTDDTAALVGRHFAADAALGDYQWA